MKKSDNNNSNLIPSDEVTIKLDDLLDSQQVMQALHISPRTLQTLRSNGIMPYTSIVGKIYYRKRDIETILSNNYTRNRIKGYESK